MKSYKRIFLFGFIICQSIVFGQTDHQIKSSFDSHSFTEDWSIGLNLHHNYLIGDLESLKSKSDKFNFGMGLQLVKQLNPSSSLGFSYFGSNLNASPPYEYGEGYQFRVETEIDVYSIFGKFYFNRLREHIGRIPTYNIYAVSGLSYVKFQYELEGIADHYELVGHGNQEDVLDTWAFFIGAGLERKLNDRWFMDFSLTAYITNSDYLDGNPTYDIASNDGDDIVMSTKIGVSYRLGKKIQRGYKWSNTYLPLDSGTETEGRFTEVENRIHRLEQSGRLDSLNGQLADSDLDSVPDLIDLEKNTPDKALVNFQGREIKVNSNVKELHYINSNIQFDPVFFDLDKSALNDKYLLNLLLVRNYLNDDRNARIQLVGHADKSGDEKYNMNLSKRRVEVIQRILMESFGIHKNRLELIWRGESETISTNKDLNRRVDFIPK